MNRAVWRCAASAKRNGKSEQMGVGGSKPRKYGVLPNWILQG